MQLFGMCGMFFFDVGIENMGVIEVMYDEIEQIVDDVWLLLCYLIGLMFSVEIVGYVGIYVVCLEGDMVMVFLYMFMVIVIEGVMYIVVVVYVVEIIMVLNG